MKLRRNNKGMVRVIEAFFASILVLSCLTLIPAQSPQPSPTVNLSSKAENIFLSLDGDGQLGGLIDNRDWAALSDSIGAALPLTTWFNLTVYDSQMTSLNEFPICNGGQPSSQVSSVTYVCVSQNSSFRVYVLQLQLAVVD